MKTNDIPQAHPSLLDALHRQDAKAHEMRPSEGFTEKVMKKVMKEEDPPLTGRVRGGSALHRIAAIFIAVAFLGGIALAAYRVLSHRQTPPTDVSILNAQPSTLNSEADGLVLFADIRLDSMLTTVAAHYGKAVFFGNEDLKGLRIHTKWNPKDSLEAFMESLNELDGLKLTEQRDTIFVQKGGVQ